MIEEYMTIKVINFMSTDFETYVTVLNEQARKDKKLSNLNELLKSLKEEENRMKTTAVLAAVHNERGGYKGSSREGREGFDRSSSYVEDSNKSYCKICYHNHDEGQCFHDRMKCYECYKKGHIQRNCSDTEATSSTSQGGGANTTRKQIIGMIRNHVSQISPVGHASPIGQFSPNGNKEFAG